MQKSVPVETCPNCHKIPELCVCTEIKPLQTRFHILILQHPQEPDKDLGTARLAHLALPNSTLKIGLSWPNLKAALGREAQPAKWAVLYLGSGIKGSSPTPDALTLVTKQGSPLPDSDEVLKGLQGLVVLDGTWSQAKTLWWRNAWLLKLRRAVLSPPRRSLYRELRKEPRKECLSTLESVSEALAALGEPMGTTEGLVNLFGKLLEKQRSLLKSKSNPTKKAAKPEPESAIS